jgi:uncharacterized protein (TIGR02646 family)
VKYIHKTNEPEVLANFKAQANDDWQPNYANFGGQDKREFHSYLIAEQGHICCYCGARIIQAESHIEHFKPKSRYRHLELDYFNLLASCQDRLQAKVPIHCGKSKDHWFDDRLLVSPLIADCEDFFEYTAIGEILPSRVTEKAERGEKTIEKLRLNIPKLQAVRASTIDSIYNDPDLQLPLSDDEIDKLIHYYSQTDSAGYYQPYCQSIVYLLKQEKMDRSK